MSPLSCSYAMMLLVALALVTAVTSRSSTETFSLGKVTDMGRHATAKMVTVIRRYPPRAVRATISLQPFIERTNHSPPSSRLQDHSFPRSTTARAARANSVLPRLSMSWSTRPASVLLACPARPSACTTELIRGSLARMLTISCLSRRSLLTYTSRMQ